MGMIPGVAFSALKILLVIGRVLLVILAVLLVILLLLLFVPFRYQLTGDGKERTLHARADVTWLLHFVRVTLSFAAGDPGGGNGKKLVIRVLGISPAELKAKLARKKKEKLKEERREKIEKIKEEDPEKYEELKEAAQARKEAKLAEKARQKEEAARRREEEARERARAGRRLEQLKIYAKQRMGYIARVVRAVNQTAEKVMAVVINGIVRLSQLPVLLSLKIGDFFAGLVSFLLKVQEWTDFLSDERTGKAVSHVMKKLKKLIGHILPRKADGYVEFGFDDPGTTGTVLAAASALYPVYGSSVRVTPDFGEKRLEGDLTVRGRLYLFYVLYLAASAVLNRNVLFVYRHFKGSKEEAS